MVSRGDAGSSTSWKKHASTLADILHKPSNTKSAPYMLQDSIWGSPLLQNIYQSIHLLDVAASRTSVPVDPRYGDVVKALVRTIRDTSKTLKACFVREAMLPSHADLVRYATEVSILQCSHGRDQSAIEALKKAASLLRNATDAPMFYSVIAEAINSVASHAENALDVCKRNPNCIRHIHCPTTHAHQHAHVAKSNTALTQSQPKHSMGWIPGHPAPLSVSS